jgi:two-component system NarL family sensor kinase
VAELTEAVAPSRVRTSARPGRLWVAYSGGALIALLGIGGLAFEIANGGSETPGGLNYVPTILVACLAFGIPGALVLAQGRAPRIGALTMLTGLGLGLAGFATGWAVWTIDTEPGSLPFAEAAVWLCTWCWIPGYCAIPMVLLFLPDDRLTSPRWKPLVAVAALAVFTLALGTSISAYALDDLPRAFGSPVNPLENDALGDALTTAGAVVFVPCVVLALVSLVLRYRRSGGVERDQLKWIALGGSATLVILAAAFAAGDQGDVVSAIGMVPLPASVAIAVLRHRMWDVDLVINRSLVYAALTVVVVAAYVGLVSVIGELVDDTVAGIVAVGVVAVALQPLHARLQRAVNQLVYGDRDDPAAALRRLGDRLVAAGEPDEVLPAVAETVARALRLPFVAVRVENGAAATHGDARTEQLMQIELLYRGEQVGELSAAPRDPGAGFSAADRRALETIGRQVAVAAHALRLTDDLRRSRERLVLAREEERRRLRHDLHDDLGPTLAALALELESGAEVGRDDPQRLGDTLERAAARARESVTDVRRLVYDLRPPTLDDLGLAGALRERAHQLSSESFEVSVEAPVDLGRLPAAVEAAAWRIASEALANVTRHAGARRCRVTLERTAGALELSVSDDGTGIAPDAAAGVGLASMRERAEELGGGLSVGERSGGGTEIWARLPLEAG